MYIVIIYELAWNQLANTGKYLCSPVDMNDEISSQGLTQVNMCIQS